MLLAAIAMTGEWGESVSVISLMFPGNFSELCSESDLCSEAPGERIYELKIKFLLRHNPM